RVCVCVCMVCVCVCVHGVCVCVCVCVCGGVFVCMVCDQIYAESGPHQGHIRGRSGPHQGQIRATSGADHGIGGKTQPSLTEEQTRSNGVRRGSRLEEEEEVILGAG